MRPTKRARTAVDISPAEYAQELKSATETVKANYELNLCPKFDICKFERLSRLAMGNFATVFRAETEFSGRPEIVAVKVMKQRDGTTQQARNEKRFMYAMDNIFILEAIGSWKDSEKLYLYMELAPYGPFLLIVLGGPVLEYKARFYIAQIVLGLEYMHAAGLIHCDVKPGNIMVCKGGRLRLADFGLTIFSTDFDTRYGGTPHYNAPELVKKQPYNDAIDWWALGVVIHQLLTGGKLPLGIELLEPKDEVYEKIITVPSLLNVDALEISANAKGLLKGLLECDPADRLGSGQQGAKLAKEHPWFGKFDFDALIRLDFEVPGFEEPLHDDMDPMVGAFTVHEPAVPGGDFNSF